MTPAPSIRIAAVATPLWQPRSVEEWSERFIGSVRFAADAGARLVVFGEYATAPLLAHNLDWAHWDGIWAGTAARAAREHNLAVCAGTHLMHDGQRLVNRCLIALPDGQAFTQDKLHPTPWEKVWRVAATDQIRVLAVAGARIAVLTCYDIEFPEAARAAARAGAEVLLVPSWTDDRQGFYRVRHCAHARAIEDCCAVVHAPLVGNLPMLPGFEQAVGSAGILTPCDIGTAPDGLAAAGAWNAAEVIVADIDLLHIRSLRSGGTVAPLNESRRIEDYQVRAEVPPPGTSSIRRSEKAPPAPVPTTGSFRRPTP